MLNGRGTLPHTDRREATMTAPLFAEGQAVVVDTQGMNIPGYNDRAWRYATGRITRVTYTVAQYSYAVELATRARGVVLPFVGVHDLRAMH